MAKPAGQMTVAKNEVAAETVAATILDLLAGAHPASARDASAYRLTRRHALELFEVAGVEGGELQELQNAAAAAYTRVDELRTELASANGHGG